MTKTPKDGTFSLTILDTTPEYAGVVKAHASNVAGEAECTANLEVRGRAPKFIEVPMKVVVMEGNYVYFVT